MPMYAQVLSCPELLQKLFIPIDLLTLLFMSANSLIMFFLPHHSLHHLYLPYSLFHQLALHCFAPFSPFPRCLTAGAPWESRATARSRAPAARSGAAPRTRAEQPVGRTRRETAKSVEPGRTRHETAGVFVGPSPAFESRVASRSD